MQCDFPHSTNLVWYLPYLTTCSWATNFSFIASIFQPFESAIFLDLHLHFRTAADLLTRNHVHGRFGTDLGVGVGVVMGMISLIGSNVSSYRIDCMLRANWIKLEM